MKIAFFDSGIGGITVLNEALKQLPNEDYIYFADTLHVPYGTKTKDEVLTFVKKSVESIIKEDDLKALVIACNTATSIAVSELRAIYHFPIIGMEPAVKPAIEMNRTTGKRVLVFATPLTLKQTKYNELVSRIDDHSIVDSLPLPELVQYCESLTFDEKVMEDYFYQKLEPFDLNEYGTIVLGCTHYPFYREILRKLLPAHIEIIDGSYGTVKRLKQLLNLAPQMNDGENTNITFMCSNHNEQYMRKMETALGILEERDKLR